MNRDRRSNPRRREVRLRMLDTGESTIFDADQVAPWLIAEVRAWPSTVEDRQVATRVGVGVQQVRRARAA